MRHGIVNTVEKFGISTQKHCANSDCVMQMIAKYSTPLD